MIRFEYIRQKSISGEALVSPHKTFTPKSKQSEETNMLNVEGLMASAFSNAVENPENINEDGSLNWNFVEADVWMDLSENLGQQVLTEDIYPTFDDLATEYLHKTGAYMEEGV
jgi:hypothetical protein